MTRYNSNAKTLPALHMNCFSPAFRQFFDSSFFLAIKIYSFLSWNLLERHHGPQDSRWTGSEPLVIARPPSRSPSHDLSSCLLVYDLDILQSITDQTEGKFSKSFEVKEASTYSSLLSGAFIHLQINLCRDHNRSTLTCHISPSRASIRYLTLRQTVATAAFPSWHQNPETHTSPLAPIRNSEYWQRSSQVRGFTEKHQQSSYLRRGKDGLLATSKQRGGQRDRVLVYQCVRERWEKWPLLDPSRGMVQDSSRSGAYFCPILELRV